MATKLLLPLILHLEETSKLSMLQVMIVRMDSTLLKMLSLNSKMVQATQAKEMPIKYLTRNYSKKTKETFSAISLESNCKKATQGYWKKIQKKRHR
jgi:hypothetical protein